MKNYCFVYHYRLAFDESDSDSAEEAVVPQYYEGDTALPIFSTTPSGYHAEKVARCLLHPDLDKVCHVQPMGVTRGATFVVDIDDVEFADLKADDLGVWKTNGTKTTHFCILPSGRIWISSKRKGRLSTYYVITRRYYVHGTYQRFRRVIVDIQGRLLSCYYNIKCPKYLMFHY